MKKIKPWQIVGTILLAGAAFYYFKNQQLKKKYNIRKEGSFELRIEKEKTK